MFARRRVCRCAALALAGLLAACGDPTVQVSFEVPAAYREQVQSVELHIVEPSEGDDSFTCDDIAFQTVPADTVELETVKTFVERDGESVALSDIPREGTKLFFIEGLDADGLPVVAACESVGVIDDDVTVTLIGEPTAFVKLPIHDPGAPFPVDEDLRVGVVDIDGTALGGLRVEWTTTGPGGELIHGEGQTRTTGEIGIIVITPAFPARPGPSALDVRARWMRTSPGPLLSFNMPEIALAEMLPGASTAGDTPARLYAVGRIGPNGEPGFAALGPSDTPLLGRELYIAYHDPALQPPFRIVTPGTIAGASAIGLIERDGVDHPVVLTATQWIEIEPTGLLSAQPLPSPQSAAENIIPIGSCDGSTGGNERILVQHGDMTPAVLAYDSDGQVVPTVFTADAAPTRPMAGGCVEGVEAGVDRTVVFATGTLSQTFITEMDSGRAGQVPALRTAIGFAPPDETANARLLATELSLDGTTISRYRFNALGSGGADAERVDHDPTVSLPQTIAGGNLDADTHVDVVAAVPFGINTEGRPQVRLLVSLGTKINGGDQRLVGLSPGFDAERVAVWLYDFDENGVDDILIGSPTAFTVLHMGEP
jgi:hypothetical protein